MTHRTARAATLLSLCAVAPALMAPGSDGCEICAPDLVIEDLAGPSWSPEPDDPPDPEYPITVVLKNAGTAPSPGFWLDLFVDESIAPSLGDLSSTYAWVDGLDTGETTTVTFVLSHPPWVLDAIADSTLDVQETRESNNIETVFP